MNLENLNVVELNAQEMQNVDGGIIPLLIVVAVGALASGCTMNVNVNNQVNNTGDNSQGGANTPPPTPADSTCVSK